MRATDDARTPPPFRFTARPLAALARLFGHPAPARAPSPPRPGERAALSRARLHVVGGPEAAGLHLAALELAAAFAARAERVLIVDGGRRVHLDERLVVDARHGLIDCLEGEVALDDAVVGTGEGGPWLLAHGRSARAERWGRLGGVLDRALERFDRVVLVLDFATPADAGQALAGRVLDAWWAELHPERRRAAQAFSERLGVDLKGMDLSAAEPGFAPGRAERAASEAETRALVAAVWAGARPARPAPTGETPGPAARDVRAPAAAAPAEGSATAAPAAAAPAEALVSPAPAAAAPADEEAIPALARALVVESDPRVRERLRFLVWAYRMRAAGATLPRPVTPRAFASPALPVFRIEREDAQPKEALPIG